jgi:nicotinamide-nucleotide amidase
MAEINKRQAFVIDGAEVMPNDRGTAPGQWIEHDGGVVALLPGPPGEMKAMFELQCLARLQRMLPPAVIGIRFYRIACIGESDVDQKIGPVYTKYANPVTTILAGLADIHVLLRARASTAEEAERLLDEPCRNIEALLGDAVYSCCGEPLEKVVGEMLVSAGKTVAFAESLTGGTLAGRFSGIPGASRYFAGGMVDYTNELKQQLLGVPREMLEKHSAVSQPVAAAMAESVRERLHTDYGVSTTGYAGPDGGDERKPVGTVFIGIAGPAGTTVRRLYFAGDRERVRTLTGVWALDLLRRALHQSSS